MEDNLIPEIPEIVTPFTLAARPRAGSMSMLNTKSNASESPNLKRPPEWDKGASPENKKTLLDKHILEEIGNTWMEKFLPKVQATVQEAAAKTDTKIDKYRTAIDDLIQGQKDILVRVERLENNPAPPPPSIDAIKEVLLPDIRSQMTKEFDGQWKHYLVGQISQVQNCLVINGVENAKSRAENFFSSFCENDLKMTKEDYDRLEIKDVRVTRAKENTKSSIFVSLGSVFQRNICLKHAKNLPNMVSMDKQIPKPYMQKYKEFKNIAWKLRCVHNVATRIDFDGPTLTLRHRKQKEKEDDKEFAFTIHKEYVPPMQPPVTKAAYTPKDGEIASPPLPPVDGTVGIMTNIQGADIEEIMNLFNMEEKLQISEATVVNKKSAVFRFESKKSCELLIKNAKEKVLKGNKVKFALL